MTMTPLEDPRYSPVMTRGDLLIDGWTDKAIARQVSAGQWVRVRRGAYVSRAAYRDSSRAGKHEFKARAVLAQSKTELALCHTSAVPLYDLQIWDIPLDDVDVLRPDGRSGRREAGVRQHRGVVHPGDICIRHGLPVVDPTRLALEVTTCLDTERALVIINQLLHRGLTTRERLQERYVRMEHAPYTLLTDIAIRRADGRHESVAETRFDHLCYTQHLPRPVPQYEVRDAVGQILAVLDFALPEYRAYIEMDGAQKYDALVPEGSTPRQVIMAEKKREKLIFDRLGWLCIRVTWEDLAHPVATAMRILRMLEGRRVA